MPEPTIDFHMRLPESWHRELKAVAEHRRLSMGDVVRQLIGTFLRERFKDDAA